MTDSGIGNRESRTRCRTVRDRRATQHPWRRASRDGAGGLLVTASTRRPGSGWGPRRRGRPRRLRSSSFACAGSARRPAGNWWRARFKQSASSHVAECEGWPHRARLRLAGPLRAHAIARGSSRPNTPSRHACAGWSASGVATSARASASRSPPPVRKSRWRRSPSAPAVLRARPGSLLRGLLAALHALGARRLFR